MTRDSFVFYRSFYDCIHLLPDEQAYALFTAICGYALDGSPVSEATPPEIAAMFTLIKPQIDANNRKYINGSKGGRPKKSQPNQFENAEDSMSDGFYTL